MTLSEAITNRINELLKTNKMNINTLANKAGISSSTIRSVVKGKCKTPTALTLYYICVGFDISLSEFYNSEFFNRDNINDD